MTTGTHSIYVVLLLVAWLSMGTSCKDKEPLTSAPKNYFTCKINGVEYKPSGYNGTPNYGINVDPNYRDGAISIGTYRYEGNDLAYSLGFGSDSLKNVGKYYLTQTGRHRMSLWNLKTSCEYYSYQTDVTIISGYFTFDTYDLENFIFSGQFEAVMAKTDGCDTLHITEGKFYYHL